MRTFLSRGGRIALAVVAALALTMSMADARVGGGSSFGSRGGRTFSAPSGTNTAPRVAPIERSMTQPGQQGFQRPLAPGGVGAQTPRFGFGTGLFAGLLGAGLLGMLFGHGFFGGLAGIGSFLGLLLQIGLIVGLVMLAVRFFRRRSEPAYAGGGYARSPLGGGLGGALGGLGLGGNSASAAAPASKDEVGIGPNDYAAFERLLGEMQAAFSREDLATLRQIMTPEMVSYIAEQMAENARKGLVNETTGVKLLQGDLAEAWRESDAEYATVAMRFSLVDVTKERATGRIVEGSTTPTEVTEVWTFRRGRGEDWKLSAIQQT